MSELLPCPFCGDEAKFSGLPRGVMGQVYCSSDDCFGPRTTALTKADSVRQWNNRPAIAAQQNGAREVGDHNLVQALHAGISRRNWHEVEQAAIKIRDDRRIKWPPRDISCLSG